MKEIIGLILCFVYGAVCEDAPQVSISQGLLVGKIMKSLYGHDIYAFQGIPYAAPPVGKLRFRPPQPAEPWEGERLAVKEGNDCPQVHPFLFDVHGDEDCLYLNVYSPNLSPDAKLSVMVWIHGGGYLSGSGSTEYAGPTFFLDHNIVLVTINYRLGALGFLSLGKKEAPGNYGLKDQVAALAWVKANIVKFGGNPFSVTIFGESAGAASVNLHILSSVSQGLFHRAISQSGSALNSWAFDKDAAENGLTIASGVGCAFENMNKTMACLRHIEPIKFIEAATLLKDELGIITALSPTVEPYDAEQPFILKDPFESLAHGNQYNVPYMAGVNTHEGILRLYTVATNVVHKNSEPFIDFTDHFERFVPDIGYEVASPEWLKLWRTIKSFYMTPANGNFLEQYFLINTDADFGVAIDRTVRSLAYSRKNKANVYYYQFAFDGGLNIFKKFMNFTYPGASHIDESGYLFTSTLLPIWLQASAEDFKVVNTMTKLWTNFAKTGNPTPDSSLGIIWDPVQVDEEGRVRTRHMIINDTLIMVPKNLNPERMNFWRNIFRMNNKDKNVS